MTGASGNSAVVNAVHPSNQYARSEIVKVLISSYQTSVICSRYSAHGWSSALWNTGASPLPEMVSQPCESSSHLILVSRIVPLAIVSLAANAEMLRESIMQRTSKSAVIFLNFIA